MSEDFDISQEKAGFPLLKEGNFASFAPVNKLVRLAYLRGAGAMHTSYILCHPPERLPHTTDSEVREKCL